MYITECLALMMQHKPTSVWPLLPTTSSTTATSVNTLPSIAAIPEGTLVTGSQQNSGMVVYCYAVHINGAT